MTIDEVITALLGQHPKRQAEALAALAETDAPPAISAVFAYLDTVARDGTARRDVYHLLVGWGDRVVPHLWARLPMRFDRDREWEWRWSGHYVRVLAAIATPLALEALTEALCAPTVNQHYAEELARVGPSGIRALVELTLAAPPVNTIAIGILGREAHWTFELVCGLMHETKYHDSLIRVLGDMGNPAALKVLFEMFHPDEPAWPLVLEMILFARPVSRLGVMLREQRDNPIWWPLCVAITEALQKINTPLALCLVAKWGVFERL